MQFVLEATAKQLSFVDTIFHYNQASVKYKCAQYGWVELILDGRE